MNNPAVQVEPLTSTRMGQGLEQWLAVAPKAYHQIQLGPAELEILQVDDSETFAIATLSSSNYAAKSFWNSIF